MTGTAVGTGLGPGVVDLDGNIVRSHPLPVGATQPITFPVAPASNHPSVVGLRF